MKKIDRDKPWCDMNPIQEVADRVEYLVVRGYNRNKWVSPSQKIPCDRITRNAFNSKSVYIEGKYVSEDEWLVKNYIRPSEIIGKRKIL